MGVCESTGSIAENVEQHRYESAHRDTDNDQPTEREQQESKRKNSLQQKINVLTWTTQKINRYKLENNKLKATNSKLNEENGELKEYVSDQNNQLLQLENELKEMDYKMSKLERETIEKEKEDNAKYSNSIHDTLYKIPGDTVTKLKYSKQSAKYVIFINGINHLFYYEENNDNNKNKKNNKSEPKCIVIRDINITNSSIKKHITKPWFLVIGTKRKALFITSTISLRNKWYNFICESLGKKHVINGHNKAQSTLSMGLFNSKHMREISEFQFKTIKFNYPSRITDCNIINNGHTIQININSNKCQLITDNNEIYQLKQFHFHIPSEHNISGKKYEMEMHLIHMNKKTNKIIVLCFIFTNKQKYKNPKLELNKSQTHLILPYNNNINIFNSSMTSMRSVSNKSLSVVKLSNIQETETDCDDSESSISSNDIPHFDINNNQKNENIFLKQFWDQLPLEKSTNNIPLKKPLNFEYLFKTSANNYTKHIKTGQVKINMQINEYIGELQIPPYTEGVKWYVSKNTHFISYKQLKTLKQIWYSYL